MWKAQGSTAGGDLFGSNLYNMFTLGLTDILYFQGRFLAEIDPAFVIVGMLGLLLTCLGMIGDIARVEGVYSLLRWMRW